MKMVASELSRRFGHSRVSLNDIDHIVRFRLRGFSAITSNTLTELTRQKVFLRSPFFSLVLIGSSVFMARFSFQQEFQILKGRFPPARCRSSARFLPSLQRRV